MSEYVSINVDYINKTFKIESTNSQDIKPLIQNWIDVALKDKEVDESIPNSYPTYNIKIEKLDNGEFKVISNVGNKAMIVMYIITMLHDIDSGGKNVIYN